MAAAATALGWGLLGQFWAQQPSVAASEAVAVSLASFIAFSYFLAAKQQPYGVEFAWRGLALAAGFLWALGFLQLQTGTALAERVGGIWAYGEYLGGPFGNPNNYAVYLVACTIPFIAGVFFSTRVSTVGVSLAAIIISSFLIDKTGSRSGLLLLSVVVATILLSKLVGRPGLYIAVCGLVGCIITVIGRFIWASSDTLFADYIASGERASDLSRLTLVERGLSYFQESAGFGIGAGHFEYRASEDGLTVTNAHNVYIEVLAEFGFPLALVMSAGAVSVLHLWWRTNQPADIQSPGFSMGTSFALVSVVIVSGLVTSSALTEPIWWVLIAITVLSVSSNRDIFQKRMSRQTSGASIESRQS